MIVKDTKCRTVLPWLLFVLAFGFIFKGIFLNAPLQSDDTTYFAYASHFSADLFKNAHHQSPFRIGILLPLAGLQKLFGYSLASYYLYSLGSSLFLLAMVYLLGFKTGGLQTALSSSLLFACSFFGLHWATNLLPDVPNSALLLGSFLAFIYLDGATGKKRILILFLSAFLAFCS
jgi:4-amino-4-deoxy-L-arabinose transferase-like glycosyltransferase